MAQAELQMMAVCGLDCSTCDIRRIPLDDQVAQRMVAWFKQMGWIKEDEGIAQVLKRKMYCHGCRSDRTIHWSKNCPMLLCCVDDKHLEHCGQCAELLTCQRIAAFVNDGQAPHREAFDRLRQMAQGAERSDA